MRANRGTFTKTSRCALRSTQSPTVSVKDFANSLDRGGVVVMHDAPFVSFDVTWSGRYSMTNNGEIAQTLKANSTGADGTSGMRTIVRRLTPMECERLMGWPDDYTAHGITDDGEVFAIANTNRYRICGNGIVATVTEWIANRLPQEQR